MGIQQGSLSLCRYRLLGAAAKTSIGTLNELLEPYKAGPLRLDKASREETFGWVRPQGLDRIDWSPSAHWDLSHAELDDGYLLRLRLERRKVPATLLQLLYKQRYFEIEEKEGKPPAPKDRREIKEKLKADLLSRALPSITHVDVFWREREGEITLFTTGKKLRETFEALFQATFAGPLGQSLVRVDPPLMGLSREEWDDASKATKALNQLSLTTPIAFADHASP